MLRIRLLRLTRSMTLWDLSQAANVSQGRLSMIERGIIAPTEPERERLANILHAPASTLFRSACRVRPADAESVCTE